MLFRSYPLSTSVSDVSTHWPSLLFLLADLPQFFEAVVGEELQEYISEREYSLMVLAACGSVVNNPEALQQLQEVTKASVSSLLLFRVPDLGFLSQV